MRRARRADLALIWPATLQTVWDDLPEDERAGLDRQTWENHFRKKIEAFVEGNRTERWIAEGPSGETLGYVILGESGFLTPETGQPLGTPEDTYLRMYVAGGGCSGFRYGLALDRKIQDGDEVVQVHGLKVLVDGNSKDYLDGSSVDYAESVAGSGFLVSNPNN